MFYYAYSTRGLLEGVLITTPGGSFDINNMIGSLKDPRITEVKPYGDGQVGMLWASEPLMGE